MDGVAPNARLLVCTMELSLVCSVLTEAAIPVRTAAPMTPRDTKGSRTRSAVEIVESDITSFLCVCVCVCVCVVWPSYI